MTQPADNDTALTLYFHSTELKPEQNFHNELLSYDLRRCLSNITDLYVRGFFPKKSVVWVNGDMLEAGIWALTDKSSHIRIYQTPRPGWCRITRTSAFFSQKFKETNRDRAAKTFRIDDLEEVDVSRSTIVVSYIAREKPIQFQVDGSIVKATNGVVDWDPFTVIDLPRHTPPAKATTNVLELSDAHQHGFELMTLGCSEERKEYVHQNYDMFKINLKDRHLRLVSNEESQTKKAADKMLTTMAKNMHNGLSAKK